MVAVFTNKSLVALEERFGGIWGDALLDGGDGFEDFELSFADDGDTFEDLESSFADEDLEPSFADDGDTFEDLEPSLESVGSRGERGRVDLVRRFALRVRLLR